MHPTSGWNLEEAEVRLMHNSKWQKILKLLLASLFVLGLLIGCTVLPDDGTSLQEGTAEPKLPQPKMLTDSREIELNSAIQKAASGREDLLAFIIYRITLDHADFSSDGNLALAWISMIDKQTGLVQNSEPGLVIAHATGDATNPWRVVFQPDADYAQELLAVPESMLSQEVKDHYMPAVQQESKDGTVYTGYRLPWARGQSVYLTGSIGHVFTYKSCPSTCLYAFDFANGSMFEIRAAKHGYVKYVQWTYANGNTTNPNYIVLEDPSTTPTTYQVYYHLAQNSIPAALRVVGAEVMQGQYIGNADDTGYSTGNHLHFHVHAAANTLWGNSVDIVFDEVNVNGGRPRTCSEASAYPEYGSECVSGNLYTSLNGDTETPTGYITSPAAYSTITSPTLNVSGWMDDDTAVSSGQLLYNTGGDWISIGDPVTVTPFTREIDLCGAGIPDGKFFLSMVVTDTAGKTSTGTQGLTELTKAYTCPALEPACSPAESQVALYTDADYQGTCQVFDIGDYSNLGSLSPSFMDNVRSIEVGGGVSVLLYPDIDYAGTLEFFQDGDSNLADNTIGAYNAASMKVMTRITPPAPATLTLPETITSDLNLTLSWMVGTGEQTRSTLTGPDDYSQSLDWQEGTSWTVGILPAGTYEWTVEARNLAGLATITQEFTVSEPTTLPLSHLNSLPDSVNSNAVTLSWEVDQGAENIDHFELQTRVPDGDWTDWTEQPAADARTMVFWGTPGQTTEFRMRAIDLIGNAEEYSSDAEARTLFVLECIVDLYEGADPGDDDISGTSLMEAGTTQTHNWCAPASRAAGDQMDYADWISFTAATGDAYQFSTTPTNLASAALLTLYEQDGVTLIGEARPSTSDASATLDWTATEDGVYYMKITPIDARIRGSDTAYEIGIELKSQIQPGTLICGSVSIPALLAAGYAVSKKVQKTRKAKERKEAMGR